MKKLLTIIALTVSATGLFAQGNIYFSQAVRGVWDDFSATAPRLGSAATTIDVAVMFGTGIPAIASISGQNLATAGNSGVYVPTNAVPLGTSFSVATAWTDILGGSFQLLDGTTAGQPAIVAAAANGSILYNGGADWSADNLVGGTTYNMYVIGWNGAYATPALAEAAGAAVGWSSYFSYTPTTGVVNPAAMSGLPTPFGVFAPVPEPGTMALAGLGGAAMLLFRRRK